ncbi:MAG: hypothetical protein HN901_05880 [Campylobacteraceae bacterium]|jgi:hypothetical protein|nr:hypothetical protein [Campylobacteraceae bacterium]
MINIMKKRWVLAATAAVLIFTGCGPQKINVPYLVPAKVAEMKDSKVVAVTKLKDDKIGLSQKIEANLTNYKIKNKKYFTVVNRSSLDKAIAEEGLQASDIIDNQTATAVGKKVGANTLIVGIVSSMKSETSTTNHERTYCLQYYKSGGCAQYKTEHYSCDHLRTNLGGTLNVIDIKSGLNIHAENISEEYSGNSCKNRLLSKDQSFERLANSAANDFTYKLSPQSKNLWITLIEEINSVKEVSKMDKQLFENSLKYIENGRIEKANVILRRLNQTFNGQSFEVLYNLAITEQSLGNLEKAKSLLKQSDEVNLGEPNKALDQAIVNIDEIIKLNKKANQQLADNRR